MKKLIITLVWTVSVAAFINMTFDITNWFSVLVILVTMLVVGLVIYWTLVDLERFLDESKEEEGSKQVKRIMEKK